MGKGKSAFCNTDASKQMKENPLSPIAVHASTVDFLR